MKTLDEVIRAVHHCGLLSGFDDTYEYDGGCPYEDCSACEKKRMLGKDILHYLKEYKDKSHRLDIQISEHVRAFEQWGVEMARLKENPPLTWDELKQMEGKPVWIEVKYHNPEAIYKYWTIVKYFDNNDGGDMVFTGTGFHYKDLLGIDWQAYRKERS